MKNFLLLTLILLTLTGCATTLTPSQPSPHTFTWHQRASALSSLRVWTAKGAMGFHSVNEGGNFSFRWDQAPAHYTLAFFGPMGAGHTVLEGNNQQVVLHTPDQKTVVAQNPDQLLASQLGWHLPVSNLIYWIRGLPAPHAASQKTLDNSMRLSTLSQQGWQIRYENYTSVDNMDLPARITLVNPKIRVRLVIYQWQIPSLSRLQQN